MINSNIKVNARWITLTDGNSFIGETNVCLPFENHIDILNLKSLQETQRFLGKYLISDICYASLHMLTFSF
jgi:hypothetical protein